MPPEKAKAANQLLNRVRFAIRSGDDSNLPDWAEGNWINILEQLTSGWLDNVKNLNDLEKLNWDAIVEYGLSREQHNFLDSIYPEFFATPHGRKIRIDYSGETPSVSARIQELYGLDTHPKTGSRKIPLRLELLSPAQRPVQITCDLPGFWRGSWDLVRKDMRSRYPKHNWPEHPEKGE